MFHDPVRCQNRIVADQVVGVHIGDAIITAGRVDQSKLRPIARLGYADNTTVRSRSGMVGRQEPDVSCLDHVSPHPTE